MRHGEPAHVLDRHDAQSIVLRTENAVTRCHWIPTAVTLSEKHGYGTKKCSVHHAEAMRAAEGLWCHQNATKM